MKPHFHRSSSQPASRSYAAPYTGSLSLLQASLGAWLVRLAGLAQQGLKGLISTLLLGMLQAYKLLISPLLGQRCRFHPTCSCYAQQSIQHHGPLRGVWLALCRLAKCGPWHPGGVDEVPGVEIANAKTVKEEFSVTGNQA